MKNIQSKIIITGFILITTIMATSIWLFSKMSVGPIEPIGPQINKKQEVAILKQIFKDGVITPRKGNGQYQVESDDKIEYSVVDSSPIREKDVGIKLIYIDLDQDGKKEIVALTTLIFLGDACTACRARFYIDVLDIKDKYFIKDEQEFKGGDSDLFYSDITIKEIQLIDINNDGTKEIQIIYEADSYFGLDKAKIAILQYQDDKFKLIWQQIINISMDGYSALPEEEKQNYGATFAFETSNEEYPDIKVNRTILKEKGIELTVPRKEKLIYRWDSLKQEYYLWEKK